MRRLLILLGLIFCASPVWGQTPGFFRSVNSSWSNITGTPTGTYGTYVWYNPGAVGSGNAVVAHFKDNTSVSSTPTIADDGSNSYTHEVTETDSNTNRLETFVALNAATARKITATESSNNDYLQGDADEFYNIATSGAVDNTSGTTGTTTGGTTDTISVGNMTGLTSGDMIEVACIADSGKINHTWTVGSGQTGITWQAGDMNAIDGFATEHGVLTGTSINPQIKLLNANAVTYACTAVALKAASAGTAPAAGVIYVDNMQHISNCIGADTSSCTSSPTSIVYQFPVNGTVLTFDYHTGSSAQIPTAISDSEMNTWHHVCDIDGLQGAPSERWWTTRTAGYDVDSITVTLNSNTNDGSAGDLLDYVNASTLDTTVGTSGCYSVTAALATSGVSSWTATTTLAAGQANEMMVCEGSNDWMTGDTITAPSGAFIGSYPTQPTEFGHDDQNNPLGLYLATTTAAQTWTIGYITNQSEVETGPGNVLLACSAIEQTPASVVRRRALVIQ